MTRILTDKFHSSRMSSFEDTTVIAASYLSAAVHVCIVNVREYILVSSPWKPKYASKSVEPAPLSLSRWVLGKVPSSHGATLRFSMVGRTSLASYHCFLLVIWIQFLVNHFWWFKFSLLYFWFLCYFWSGFSNAMLLINMLCNTFFNVTYHCPGEYKMSIVPSIRRQWCLHTPYHLHALPGLPQNGGEVQVINNLHKDQVLW